VGRLVHQDSLTVGLHHQLDPLKLPPDLPDFFDDAFDLYLILNVILGARISPSNRTGENCALDRFTPLTAVFLRSLHW
jgi:hypothetical protein